MPFGRAGRRWFVAGGVAAAAVAIGAGLAQPWARESRTAGVWSGGASPGSAADAVEVVETGVALRSTVAGVTEYQGELVALTSGGEVVRSADGRAWEQASATGFTPRPRNADECAGDTVRGVAAYGYLLVAVGARAVEPAPGDQYCDTRLEVWVSTDAATWNAVEPSGLAETDSVDTVVAHPSGFLAFGYASVPRTEQGGGEGEDEEHGRGLAVWRSTDGVAWETVPTEGLSKPAEYKYQLVNSVAVHDDRMLAALGVECVGCYDDHVVALWRADGVSAWQELTFTGLEALDQANTDIVPAVAATDEGYLAFASVGRDHGDDRTPTAWSSPDGERWEEAVLPGPSPSGGVMDAATAWSRGVVALDSTRHGLVVWRIDTR